MIPIPQGQIGHPVGMIRVQAEGRLDHILVDTINDMRRIEGALLHSQEIGVRLPVPWDRGKLLGQDWPWTAEYVVPGTGMVNFSLSVRSLFLL
jgi:hypothetical protein